MGLVSYLQNLEPFNQIPEALFEEISASATIKTYLPRTFIFQQNDYPTGYLYVVKEGLVEITVITPGGTDMVVDYRKEGSFLGGTPIFTEEPYTGGARTVKTTQCYLIPQEVLRRAARDCPGIREYFTRLVLSRLRQLYLEIVSDHHRMALTHVEAYPFKKRLSEVMITPAETCLGEDGVRVVARRMAEKRIGSLPVVDEQNRLSGIITENDLVTKVLAPEGGDPDALCARDIMTAETFTLPPSTFMYEAMSFMIGHRIKHLPVVDAEELVGIVSLRDLMRYRSHKAMILVGSIRDETTIAGLADIHKEAVGVARSLLSETRSAPEVMEILSYIHHSIIRRTFEICLEQTKAEGRQLPDIRFAFIIMGSGGRREMLLRPDQDHGFVFENVPDARLGEIDAFYGPLSDRLVEALAEVGYPLCRGRVMANNPQWRGRLCDWYSRIRGWVNDPEPQAVRYSSIFFDFVTLTGDPSLAHDLRHIVTDQIRQFQGFLYHMMSLDLRYKVPVGLFGRFLVEKDGERKGELSLKQGGSIYLVDCIRMFALEKEIQSVTTLDRLKELVQLNVFAPETAEHVRAAFEALSFLRLRNEVNLIEQGKKPSHYIDPYSLSPNEQDLLRESFHAVAKLQDAAKRHFSKAPF